MFMKGIGIGSAATKLTDKILGYNTDSVDDIMKDIAAEYGLSHIVYLSLATNKSANSSLLSAFTTFSKEWQARYFLKQYITIDPVIERGRTAILPYDWQTLETGNPKISEFFKDAIRHNVGRNGISIPVRNRRNANSIVSFTSDARRPAWEAFKKQNMVRLQHLAALMNSATIVNSRIPGDANSTFATRGTVPYLGGSRKDATGNWRYFRLEPHQHPESSGYSST